MHTCKRLFRQGVQIQDSSREVTYHHCKSSGRQQLRWNTNGLTLIAILVAASREASRRNRARAREPSNM